MVLMGSSWLTLTNGGVLVGNKLLFRGARGACVPTAKRG